MTRPDLNNLRAAVITAPPDVVLAALGRVDVYGLTACRSRSGPVSFSATC